MAKAKKNKFNYVSKKAKRAAFLRALKRFKDAHDSLIMMGSYHPDDWRGIEEHYAASQERLVRVAVDCGYFAGLEVVE